MPQRIRESLAILLITILPLHALLVTVLTKAIAGAGHAPLPVLAVWKEGLLGIILLLAAYEVFRSRDAASRLRVDLIDALIAALILLSIIVTIFTHGDLKLYLFGFKYDFVPLIAFMILRRVNWSADFQEQAFKVLLAIGGVVAAYGILTFFLPQQFFTALGYSDLHSLYLPDSPLAAFQQIGGSGLRRVQSTMSGPNQLGLWLLLPWTLGLLKVLKGKQLFQWIAYFGIIDFALFLTFSRSAWIAACVIIIIALFRGDADATIRKAALWLLGIFGILLIVGGIFAPNIILRIASSSDHLERPFIAIATILEKPLGWGMGLAGPASNRVSDACVYLPRGADASWAADRPNLCVFVGNAQIQPVDRACECPFLPENWYLQIGVELGILGFVLFVTLIVLILRRVFKTSGELDQIIAFGFLGVSIAALFLHAWEDAAVSLTLWALLSSAAASK